MAIAGAQPSTVVLAELDPALDLKIVNLWHANDAPVLIVALEDGSVIQIEYEEIVFRPPPGPGEPPHLGPPEGES